MSGLPVIISDSIHDADSLVIIVFLLIIASTACTTCHLANEQITTGE